MLASRLPEPERGGQAMRPVGFQGWAPTRVLPRGRLGVVRKCARPWLRSCRLRHAAGVTRRQRHGVYSLFATRPASSRAFFIGTLRICLKRHASAGRQAQAGRMTCHSRHNFSKSAFCPALCRVSFFRTARQPSERLQLQDRHHAEQRAGTGYYSRLAGLLLAAAGRQISAPSAGLRRLRHHYVRARNDGA